MKFYKDYRYSYYWIKIINNKLTSIYSDCYNILFLKNGKIHNIKNAAYINGIYKNYYLNNNLYGNQNDFTKSSWRKFTKLQAFL